jgi:hypothetical protein
MQPSSDLAASLQEASVALPFGPSAAALDSRRLSQWRAFFTRNVWRSRNYLLSPFWDLLMIGGGAIGSLWLILWLIPSQRHAIEDPTRMALLGTVAQGLMFIVNYPHFMVSYQLLYDGYAKKLRRFESKPAMRWRYINAGLIVPALLVGFLAYAAWRGVTRGEYALIGWGLAAMYFSVGWHYMKQSFGVFVMLSALKSIFYTPWQRRIFLWNCYVTWLYSWCIGPLAPSAYIHNKGIHMAQKAAAAVVLPSAPAFVPPTWLQYALLALFLLSSLTTLGALLYSWKKQGKIPSFTALLGYSSMYYLLAFANWMHPAWLLIVPFFHSLQYLLFVAAYRRGHYRQDLHLASTLPDPEKARKRLRGQHERFYGYAFLLGILGFYLIPGLLDHYSLSGKWLPASFFMTAFTIFINIHHYFIDNVIWRKENTEVGERIFRWSRQEAGQITVAKPVIP